MSALLVELARTILFLSSPPHVQSEDALLEGVSCPTWRSCKTLPLVRLATHKLLVYGEAVFVLELLAITLSDKHKANVLKKIMTGLKLFISFYIVNGIQKFNSFKC